jgi:hypothetical protein
VLIRDWQDFAPRRQCRCSARNPFERVLESAAIRLQSFAIADGQERMARGGRFFSLS